MRLRGRRGGYLWRVRCRPRLVVLSQRVLLLLLLLRLLPRLGLMWPLRLIRV